MTPGITIRDRLRVLIPNAPDSYYRAFDILPAELLQRLQAATVVITNYHAFIRRDKFDASATTKKVLGGANADPDRFKETEGEMVRRVLRAIGNKKQIAVINDEAHHCYQAAADDTKDAAEKLSGEEKREQEEANKAAYVWLSGLRAVQRKIGIRAVFDLSATPFFLGGSGYQEGTLFPWVVSDFSLIDAIESGVVKIPRVPVSDDSMTGDLPTFRDLWVRIRDELPKRGRTASDVSGDPRLPKELESALRSPVRRLSEVIRALPGGGAGDPAGLHRGLLQHHRQQDGLRLGCRLHTDRCRRPDLRPHGQPGPLLECPGWRVDGPAELVADRLSPARVRRRDGRRLQEDRRDRDRRVQGRASQAGRQSRRHYRRRHPARGDEHHRQEGEAGRADSVCRQRLDADRGLGRQHRHPHPGGARLRHAAAVRAGRRPGLRRISYDADENGMFEPEYAEVFGVPFSFIPSVGDPKPATTKPIHRVYALPERANLEISFPRVIGYRWDMPMERLMAEFAPESTLTLATDEVPTLVQLDPIVGQSIETTMDELRLFRRQQVAFSLAKRVTESYLVDAESRPKPWLFPQVLALVDRWMSEHVVLKDNAFLQMLMITAYSHAAAEKIYAAIGRGAAGEQRLLPMLRPYDPIGSTGEVDFQTTRTVYETFKSHINYLVEDSGWESKVGFVLDHMAEVESWMKNTGILRIPYTHEGNAKATTSRTSSYGFAMGTTTRSIS